MNKPDCFIIMGARVKEDGEPSGAMTRRVNSALASGVKKTDTLFLVTGGFGNSGFSEAGTMKNLLMQSGISEINILQEDQSTNTLSSVIFCSGIIKNREDIGTTYIISDIYHVPRCRWLFYLSGINTRSFPVISGRKVNGILKWIYFYIREFIAIPFDTALICLYRINKKVT